MFELVQYTIDTDLFSLLWSVTTIQDYKIWWQWWRQWQR